MARIIAATEQPLNRWERDPTAWWKAASLLVIPAALGLLSWTKGLRSEHWLAAVLFLVLAWLGPRARRFSALALPFVLAGLLYDHFAMMLPLRAEVHVADLYRLEQMLFGVASADGVITWPEWLMQHPVAWLDAITGFAYLFYIFEMFLVAAWLYVRGRDAQMSRIAWGFFWANAIGMVIWLGYPAAPPWYVMEHGLGPAKLDVAASAAGAQRFDTLFGIRYFEQFYARNVNVFGAMPSLHVAYPTSVACSVWSLQGAWRPATWGFTALVAFSAVYLGHHYILDVIAGVLVGLGADRLAVLSWRRFHGGSAGHEAVRGEEASV